MSTVDNQIAVGETPPDWSAFAEYVRNNPETMSRPAEELAVEFKLEADFIRNFLSAMRAPIEQESFLEAGVRGIKKGAQRIGQMIRATFTGLTARPPLCLALTLFLSFGTIILFTILAASLRLGDNFIVTGAAGAVIGAVTVFSVATQAVCYYRHAKIRYVFGFSVFVFAGWFLFMSVSVNEAGRAAMAENQAPPLAIFILTSAILSALYFIFGATATLVGSYANYRRASKEEVEVSRQELLNRLFFVESRLSMMGNSQSGVRVRWIDRMRTMRTFFVGAMLVGIFVGMLEVVIFGSYTRMTGMKFQFEMNLPMPLLISATGMFAVKAGAAFLLGFLGGRPGRSMSTILMMLVGIWIAAWFPLGGYGPSYALSMLTIPNLLETVLTVVLVGTFTGYLALVEDRSYRQQRLKTDDLPSLLAEQIQLQWRLGLGQQATTVLVVDVAKSTVMKSNEDPLRVEFSFREYQGMVEEISLRHGGHVLSTAGDGAVVGFGRPDLAVEAGREILTALPGFNMRQNRLDTPFRLRIGIHAGQTEASLADAPFNEVIDIAAHIEGVAPIGGIAVSGVVREAVTEGVEFAEMARPVDGQSVFVVLNPTVEV